MPEPTPDIPRMRIIYFSSSYSPHDHRFLAALAKTDHEVFYLRLAPDMKASERRPVPSSVEQISWAGGSWSFRWGDVPARVLELRRIVHQIHPDLIHAGPIQTCAFLSVLSGFRPVLTMSWGFDLMQDAERNLWWRWVTSYTLRHSTFFTSDAGVTKERAVAFGMDADRTAVFPWGVDLRLFAPGKSRPPDARKRSGRRGDLVLLCNRSWEPRYGVDVLARAFALALRRDQRLTLLLIGGGSQTHVIRGILEDGGAIDRVLFAGHVEYADLPRWYHMADVFVSPSHVDGSSVSLMEALACGIPPLVSDIPANREWVRHDVNGWLFKDGDAEGLADQIVTLAGRRRKLAPIGRAARATAEQKADWSRNFAILLQAYERTLQYN